MGNIRRALTTEKGKGKTKKQWQICQLHSYLIINNLLYFIFILNHSPASNNLSAIFIEKEKIKVVYPDGGIK